MKTITNFVATAIFFTFFLGHAQHKKPHDRVSVDSELKSHWNRFVILMEKNNIPVDYDKLNSVDLAPLASGIQGFWSETSKAVLINYYFRLPASATDKESDDLLLICLAHEVGHAMGWRHIESEVVGLMNPSSKFDMSIIRGSIGAEQYIINTFQARLCPD